MNFQQQTRRDSVVDTELDEGDVPIPSTSVVDADSRREPTAKRKVKPVLRLGYDEPGQSTDRPVTISFRGMIIQISYCPDAIQIH